MAEAGKVLKERENEGLVGVASDDEGSDGDDDDS